MTKWPLSIKKKRARNFPLSVPDRANWTGWLSTVRCWTNPGVIPPAYFKDKGGNSTLKVTWYSEGDMNIVASVKPDMDINRTFVDGAQPDASVPANQPFSVVWEGELYPSESGQYLLGVETNRGVRMYVNGQQLIDEYYNESPIKQDRR